MNASRSRLTGACYGLLTIVLAGAPALGQCEEAELTSIEPGFATSVALLADRALVGATVGTGSVLVFERTGGVWQEVDQLTSGAAGADGFGVVAALAPDRAVVGARRRRERRCSACRWVRSSGASGPRGSTAQPWSSRTRPS